MRVVTAEEKEERGTTFVHNIPEYNFNEMGNNNK